MPSLRNLHKLADPEIRAKNVLALKYALRGLYWDTARPKVADPIFVVGCSRSGTTVTYETIAAHGDDIEVVIPPRSTAAPSGARGPPTQRDLHMAMVTEHGRLGWQAAAGYGTLFRGPGAGVAQPPSTRRAVLQKETV